MDILELIANTGGNLGLAIFAILMLQRAYKERVRELEAEREALIETIERNTSAWVRATETMTMLAETVGRNARDLTHIRVILARKTTYPTDELLEDGG